MQALGERDALPTGYLEEILEMRAYARAYGQYQAVNGDLTQLPTSSLFHLVREIHIAVAETSVAEAKEGA